ncbi:DndE family protein [Lebetimonas sp. JH292]|uniref:DndE family protein n=1 Tax=Lebetimonas sp. JH292 TaxID=990068 RepID=UPI000467126A|nr:DndE family protein [Lebetimonas sp. JH292]
MRTTKFIEESIPKIAKLYTDIIALMVANNDNIEFKNEKELEKYLELHAQRGFEILTSSLNQNSF